MKVKCVSKWNIKMKYCSAADALASKLNITVWYGPQQMSHHNDTNSLFSEMEIVMQK